MMKISIGSTGRFWAYDLARQLERLGCLHRLYTGYPKWKVDGLPRDKIRSLPWLISPAMLFGKWGLGRVQEAMNWPSIDTFDRWMAARLQPCEVFHCLSSFGLRAHRAAREKYGALTVCDRGSSHIVFQDEILAEEYARWNIAYQHIDRRFVDQELQEYEECDLITVPSEFVYSSFLKKGVPGSKLRKVPYGVDLSTFRPAPKEDDIFRVIYAGAMSLRKGLPYLLQAVEPLRLPKFEVWLIGGLSPEIKPFLNDFNGNCRYLGFKPRTELYRYYSRGSVFVLPSIEEGLALVQAQAMACGLPVIATTNTGAADLLTDGVEGFIVPIRDPQAIREQILYLYENPNVREEMSQAALARVLQLGGWDNYGQQMVATYQQALAPRTNEDRSLSCVSC